MPLPVSYDRRARATATTPALPLVVADDEQEGLTAAVTTTVLYVPQASGMYRATVYAECTTGGDAITLSVSVGGSTLIGTGGLVAALSLNATGATRSFELLKITGGNPISLATTLSGARVNSIYKIRTVVERMS